MIVVAARKSKKRLKRATKVWLVIGVIVGVLVVAPLLIRAGQKIYIHTVLNSKTESALKDTLPIADQSHVLLLGKVSKAIDVEGYSQPAVSYKYKTCYTSHNDSGWMAVNYNLYCRLVYQDIIEFTKSSDLEAKLAKAEESKKDFRDKLKNLNDGEDDNNISLSDMYTRVLFNDLNSKDTPALLELDAYSDKVSFFTTLPGAKASIEEIGNYPYVLMTDTVTYASSDADRNKVLLDEKSNGSIAQNKDYFIMVYSKGYFSKDIGCAFPEIIFCRSPY